MCFFFSRTAINGLAGTKGGNHYEIAHKFRQLAKLDYENTESIIADISSIRSTFNNTRLLFYAYCRHTHIWTLSREIQCVKLGHVQS